MRRLGPTRSDTKSPGERKKSPGKGECGHEDREKQYLRNQGGTDKFLAWSMYRATP